MMIAAMMTMIPRGRRRHAPIVLGVAQVEVVVDGVAPSAGPTDPPPLAPTAAAVVVVVVVGRGGEGSGSYSSSPPSGGEEVSQSIHTADGRVGGDFFVTPVLRDD
jgi:hypothetical protein